MTLSPETPAPLGTDTGPDLRETQRIYVACLAAYNNGHLHGAWIEATSPDEVRDKVRAMLAASPEPDGDEWSIHGATRKSHLLSEAGMPLVEPSRPFLAGACELGNRLVRSLRKRAGSW
ncbi:MAG: antirestriction protein ArdA, partial [Alphaproteobacteria bacterium]